MELIKLKTKDIVPYENNARINDKAVDKVAKSIEDNGYIAPIVIDENNIVLAGHTRLKALYKLGINEVECIIKKGLTETQKKAYRIADNKTGEIADWDFDLLNSELQELVDSGYELSNLGFNQLELDKIVGQTIESMDDYLDLREGKKEKKSEDKEEEDDDEGDLKESNFNYKEQYGVIVMCNDEKTQEQVYNDLTNQGYSCKVVAT